jgi:hypothetical protein
MLAQADFQRALAQALGEFAPAWRIVGECVPVDRFDTSHWGSGPQSFQVTLRHGVTGHLKVLGRRAADEPRATVHPAVALSLIGSYRHGHTEPIRAYLEEIGVAAGGASPATQVFRHPAVAPSAQAPVAAPARAAGLGGVRPIAAAARAASIGVVDSLPPENEHLIQPSEPARSWSLKPKWPSLLTTGSRPQPELPPSPPPVRRRSMPVSPTVETRRPVLGRLRRELQIWYWRRGVGSALDKKSTSD